MERTKLIKSEVIALFNTTKETLRHYEQKGLIHPEVDDNKYRYYDFKDLQKLRQIFLMKDLDLTIDQMRRMDRNDVPQEEYLDLLKERHGRLSQKIKRLQQTQAHIESMVHLLEEGDNNRVYRLEDQPDRTYYLFDRFESDHMATVKDYYDHFSDLIESGSYTERVMQMMYPYQSLDHTAMMASQLCMYLPGGAKDLTSVMVEDHMTTLAAGLYLSIIYPFKEGAFEDLQGLKEEIERYLQANHLERVGDVVLEEEHPELSILVGQGVSIYELQFAVRRKP